MKLSNFLPFFTSLVAMSSISASATASCDVQNLLVEKVEHGLAKQGLKLNQIDQISLREDGFYIVNFHYRGYVKFAGSGKMVSNDDGSVALKVDEQACVAKTNLEK